MSHYKKNDIRAGDPNEGIWHLAHYPLPSCLGGQQTVALLAEHHAIQGILQSEEFRTPCVMGWEKEFTPTSLLPTLKKWMSIQRRDAQLNAWANYTKEEKLVRCKSISQGNKKFYDQEGEAQREARVATQIATSTKKKAIEVTAPSGKRLEFPSIRGAARELGLDSSRLTQVLKGRIRTTMGFTARYV